jgi:hypothetical protein
MKDRSERIVPSSFVLSLADVSCLALYAGDETAARVLDFLARAAQLPPAPDPLPPGARCLQVVTDGGHAVAGDLPYTADAVCVLVSPDAPETIRLVAAEGRSLFYRAYQGGDVSLELRQPYELWQGGVLTQTGDIGSSTGGSQALITLPTPGAYSLTLPFTYTLGGAEMVTGHGRAVAEFDTTLYATDANPPFVTVLRLQQNGAPTDVVYGPVELHLAISDTVDATPVVSVDYDVGAGWTPVAVVQTADDYVAALPGFVDGTQVNLRISAADASGNKLIHILEPAYLVR